MWHYGWDPGFVGGWGWGIGGPIFQLLVIVLVIAAVVWFVRKTTRSGGASGREHRSRGLDVLQERYARGEINRDEYLQKKRDMLDGT